MSQKLLAATLPKNENPCMRIKAKLPDTIARAGEPDPMCEKRCNAQDSGIYVSMLRKCEILGN